MYPTFQTLMTNSAPILLQSASDNGRMRNESIVGRSFIKFCPQHTLSGYSTITLTFKRLLWFPETKYLNFYLLPPDNEMKVTPDLQMTDTFFVPSNTFFVSAVPELELPVAGPSPGL